MTLALSDERFGKAEATGAGRELPIIDVAGLSSARRADRLDVALALRLAALDRGFFYMVGHGIEESLIARVMVEARAFFALPLADKMALDKARAGGVRGYEPLRGQTLEAGGAADLKEGFYIGRELGAGERPAGRFNGARNQWPEGRPAFRRAMLDYHAALLALSVRLMRGVALSLDLPEDFFDAFCVDPIAILRLLHYPPQAGPDPAGAKGAGAHTDFGALTLLLQDDVGGLEVHDPVSGAWTSVPPLAGAYVVNLGDLIARWSNGRYCSARHRVLGPAGRRRYSVPFFLSGAPDHRIACLPGCLSPGERAKYPPTTVEFHLQERYLQTYGA